MADQRRYNYQSSSSQPNRQRHTTKSLNEDSTNSQPRNSPTRGTTGNQPRSLQARSSASRQRVTSRQPSQPASKYSRSAYETRYSEQTPRRSAPSSPQPAVHYGARQATGQTNSHLPLVLAAIALVLALVFAVRAISFAPMQTQLTQLRKTVAQEQEQLDSLTADNASLQDSIDTRQITIDAYNELKNS